jgi:hypothetical protein
VVLQIPPGPRPDCNLATTVTDRTSKLRITGLRATAVGSKTFVRIDTNYGLHGWGEIQ